MLRYTAQRLLTAIPTLLVISFVIFAILDLAPNDPTGNLPLTIDAETRAKIREQMGMNEPFLVRYAIWIRQFFIFEPIAIIETAFDTDIHWFEGPQRIAPVCGWDGDWWETPLTLRCDGWERVTYEERLRIRSWSTRSEVVDLIVERAPQTLWVVGLSYLVAILVAVPIGIISAVKQYSWFDQAGTFVSMVGFSVPTFFTGIVLIEIFAVNLGWFPSDYNTTLKVVDWESFQLQLHQMTLPVIVLALFNAAQISRFMRASTLDNMNQDYVRTARAKGLRERAVVMIHVVRNSLIPVVTVIALGVPTIFAGAIITEQVFRINGLGALLIQGTVGGDIPLVQTLTFVFAVLIVLFNLIADILYGVLDPRIRYD